VVKEDMSLIRQILEKMACKHKWESISEWIRVYPMYEYNYYGERYINWNDKQKCYLTCKKCGKIEQIVGHPTYYKKAKK
jgi:hypothetical protein